MVNNLLEFIGDCIFIDANIFVYFFRINPKYSPISKEFLSKLNANVSCEFEGFTTPPVLEEVCYTLLIRSIADDYDKHPTEVIRDNPYVVKEYTDKLRDAMDIISRINGITMLDVPKDITMEMVNEMKYGILPRDALYLAIMKQEDIVDLASYDSDFDRASNITRWGI